jgi:hypothetical protein
MTTFTAWISIPRVSRSAKGSVSISAHAVISAYRTRADEVAANTVSKIMENAISVSLEHFGVRVETRIAEFGDLLCEKFHPVSRVAEYNGLVDLELGAVLDSQWVPQESRYLGE